MRTAEQQLAIDSREKNILVSAAAGAGKTTVLVARIMKRVIEDRADIARLIVVTFTRDAANVMRQRLQTELEKKAAESGEDARHCSETLDALPDADITTMDSFCIKLLRKYHHLVGIPSDFRAVDPKRMDSLRDRVLRDLFEDEHRSASIAFKRLWRQFGRVRGDDGIADLIYALRDNMYNQPDPYGWIMGAVRNYREYDASDMTHPWNALIADIVRIELDPLLAALEKLAAYCESCYPRAYATIDSDIAYLSCISNATGNGSGALCDAIAGGSFVRISTKPKGDVSEILKHEYVKRERDAIKSTASGVIKKLNTLLSFDVREDIEISLSMASELARLTTEYDSRLVAAMKKSGMIDFSTVEQLALTALRMGAAEELRSRVDGIFFDEYQDANGVQEEIARLLSDRADLFLVGDVKQSIYRFRLSDPGLFTDKFNRWGRNEGGTRIDLSKNFRSSPMILQAVNDVFSRIMTGGRYGVAYEDAAMLVPGIADDKREQRVELNVILSKEAVDGGDESDELAQMRSDEIEGRLVAGRVAELLRGGTYSDASGKTYPIKKKDICVLLRSPSGCAESVSRAMDELGIDNIAQLDSKHFDTIEARALLDVLRTLDNPYRDVALVGALRSPIFLWSLEDLARVRLNDKKASFIDALKKTAEADDALGVAARDTLKKLSDWRMLSKVLTCDILVERIIEETGFDDLMAASRLGERKLANIRLFVRRMREFAEEGASTLSRVVECADDIARLGDRDESRDNVGDADVVSIMSIHKSKGQEYPVVIVAMLGRKLNLRQRSSVVCDKDLGFAIPVMDERGLTHEGLSEFVIKRASRLQDIEEEKRLLYVAMTRAMDRLVLFGTTKTDIAGDKDEERLTSPLDMLNWILPCSGGDAWKVVKRLPAEAAGIDAPAPAKEIGEEEKPASRSILSEAFDHVYPYSAESSTPVKTSVSRVQKLYGEDTDIAEDIEKPHLPLRSRPEFIGGENIGARRGTATHLACRHLRFADARDRASVEMQLDSMVERGFMLENDRRLIDPDSIVRLATGELGQELAEAEKSGMLFRETPFTLAVPAREIWNTECRNNAMVQGAVDAWIRYPDGVKIVDFKTDRWNGDVKLLAEKYRLQLYWYQRALTKLTGLPAKSTVLYSLYLGLSCPIEFEGV